MRTRAVLIATSVAGLLVSCSSSSDSSAPSPQCSTWESRPVTSDEFDRAQQGCWDGNTFQLSFTRECADGRRLFWNDHGWAIVGETLTTYPAGAEKVAPVTARESC